MHGSSRKYRFERCPVFRDRARSQPRLRRAVWPRLCNGHRAQPMGQRQAAPGPTLRLWSAWQLSAAETLIQAAPLPAAHSESNVRILLVAQSAQPRRRRLGPAKFAAWPERLSLQAVNLAQAPARSATLQPPLLEAAGFAAWPGRLPSQPVNFAPAPGRSASLQRPLLGAVEFAPAAQLLRADSQVLGQGLPERSPAAVTAPVLIARQWPAKPLVQAALP
jgi:hypothetical protein